MNISLLSPEFQPTFAKGFSVQSLTHTPMPPLIITFRVLGEKSGKLSLKTRAKENLFSSELEILYND